MAISGSTAIVGDPLYYAGAVYVYVRSGSTWSQQATITPTDSTTNDRFGWYVAFNGTILVVGAINHSNGSSGTGAAYVYVRNGSTWTQQAELKAGPATHGLGFGYKVAIYGQTILVTMQSYLENEVGAAFVYVFNGTSWVEEAKLSASDGTSTDAFGVSVAVSGNNVMIGAPGKNSNSGAAYVFVRSGTTWPQQAEVIPSDVRVNNGLGTAVALNGATALIGAGPKSTVYVYVGGGSTWTQQAELSASTGAYPFGSALALSGNTAVIGAYQTPNLSGVVCGVAYVYVRSGTSWAQQAELTSSDGAYRDQFGAAVALSGSTALIGAPGKPAAYVFVAG